MNREKALRIVLFVSSILAILTVVNFVYFIDQFPINEGWSLTIKNIDFLDASLIANKSLTYMIFLIIYNVAVLGLSIVFFKPKEKRLIELAGYNIVLSVSFLLALVVYVNLFPEIISGVIDHKFFYTEFYVDGEAFRAINIMYILGMLYVGLNIIFLSIKSEK